MTADSTTKTLGLEARGQALEGRPVPEGCFQVLTDEGLQDLSTQEVFAGKTVALFALPGAFTPTCSSAHVPRYQQLLPALKAAGVDSVACLSVNDAFVMKAWCADQGAEDLLFLADGNGRFTEDLGLLVGKEDLGFGRRAWRFSMLVRDGVIEKVFVEPEVPGDPYGVSDADTMLEYVSGGAPKPPEVLLFVRKGCAHCARAEDALERAGIPYDTVPANPRRLLAAAGRTSTPQVFVDGSHVGGADELEAWLKDRS